MNYTFVFLGETIHGSDTEIIKKKLAHKFNVSLSDIEQLFVKGAKFEREGITQEVATAYQNEFAEADAIGHVLTSVKKLNPSDNTTPLSKSRVEIKAQKSNNKKNTSSVWIKWAGIIIVAVLAADRFLQSALIVDSYGLDIGYLPLILAHIPLIIGCSLLAKEKGFSQSLGFLLGLFSLAGLSILILLPPKEDNDHKISVLTLCIVIFNFAVFFYWVNSFWSNSKNIDELLSNTNTLHVGRSEFPQARQSSHQDYLQEQQELYDHFEHLISTIESGNIRPDDISKLGDHLFSELARYAVWRNYQLFKHKNTNAKLPEALKEDFFKKDAALFGSLISRITQQSTPRLNEIASDWLISPNDKQRTLDEYKTGQRMGQVFDAVRDANILNTSTKNTGQKPNVSQFVQQLKLPEFSNSQLTRHDNYVNYSFDNGYSITIGFYTKTSKSKFKQKIHYSNQYIVISNQYPAKYLHKLLGVFDGYNSFY